MPPRVTHLLQVPAGKQGKEQYFPLLQTGQLRLEQIVSRGQASPADFCYDQPTPQWVGPARRQRVPGVR